MATNFYLKEMLGELKCLIDGGQAASAIGRLNLLLANYQPASGRIEQAYIFRLLSCAFKSINEQLTAKAYLKRATSILDQSERTFEHSEILMLLAEDLSQEGLHKEALHFAESAIELPAMNVKNIYPEDVADLLRRFSIIALRAEKFASSQMALTIGVILISKAAGIDSDVGDALEDLVRNSCLADGDVLSAIGKHYLNGGLVN